MIRIQNLWMLEVSILHLFLILEKSRTAGQKLKLKSDHN